MLKLVTVVGARPQFIKLAPVSRALREAGIQETLVHTGQHYDHGMSDVFFDELGIPAPDHNLGIGSGSHGAQTGEMLGRVEEILLSTRPDWVMVYGDTNSTLAGALAASKLHIPIAHVEAGLRSFNRQMPEEINRVLTDHVSTLLFCPTETSVKNLAAEGITRGVHLVGDVMLDALLDAKERAKDRSTILQRLGLQEKSYLLATVHRAENTDDPERLRSIMAALAKLAETEPVIFPVHPRTRKALDSIGFRVSLRDLQVSDLIPHPSLEVSQPSTLNSQLAAAPRPLSAEASAKEDPSSAPRPLSEASAKEDPSSDAAPSSVLRPLPSDLRPPTPDLRFIPPLGYLDTVRLSASARVILTDSGGLQKEACWLGVPCVTLREETEWVETVESGCNLLAGADTGRIVAAVRHSTKEMSAEFNLVRSCASGTIAETFRQVQPGASSVTLV